MGQGSSPTEHGEQAQHALQKEKAINSYLYIANPAMGNMSLEQWKGGCPGRIERQQGSIRITLTAAKSALAETGLSLWISMKGKEKRHKEQSSVGFESEQWEEEEAQGGLQG